MFSAYNNVQGKFGRNDQLFAFPEEKASLVSFPHPHVSDHAAKIRQYRVLPHRDFDINKEREVLVRALERIRNEHPVAYNLYLELSELEEKPFLSEAHLVTHFAQKLSGGCCSGIANSLFHSMYNRRYSSLKESAENLQWEDVFFRQMLELIQYPKTRSITQSDIRCHVLSKIERYATLQFQKGLQSLQDPEARSEYIRRHRVSRGRLNAHFLHPVIAGINIFLLDPYGYLATMTGLRSNSECDEYVTQYKQKMEEMENQRQESLEHLHQDCYDLTFTKSDPFFVDTSSYEYQLSFGNALLNFPEARDFVGTIELPEHVISFQYGEKGCFLYDSLSVNHGLYEYPDKKIFLATMRDHIRCDVLQSQKQIVKEGYPEASAEEIAEKVQEAVATTRVNFCIQPL